MPRGFWSGLFGDRKRPAKPVATPVGRGGKPVATPVRPVATPVRPIAIPVPQIKPVAVPQPMTIGRGEEPTGERTDIVVPHEGVEMFLAGTKLNVTSSWLSWVKYDRAAEEMEAQFLDGFRCTYEDISEGEASSFFDAPSKGGWVHDHILGPDWSPAHPGANTIKRWH